VPLGTWGISSRAVIACLFVLQMCGLTGVAAPRHDGTASPPSQGVLVSRQVCPFHTEESVPGMTMPDGSVSYTCELMGHPYAGPWSWLVAPPPPPVPGVSGTATELNLATELPAAIEALGAGWFEYGLVERSYAQRQPAEFARMVAQWGHTAIQPKQYTVSAYIARTLGQLGRAGAVAYHAGPGTGRWRYNDPISWWSLPPGGPWETRTSWVSIVSDSDQASQDADLTCRAYVPGA